MIPGVSSPQKAMNGIDHFINTQQDYSLDKTSRLAYDLGMNGKPHFFLGLAACADVLSTCRMSLFTIAINLRVGTRSSGDFCRFGRFSCLVISR
jgi:hypothetical protein